MSNLFDSLFKAWVFVYFFLKKKKKILLVIYKRKFTLTNKLWKNLQWPSSYNKHGN